MEKTARKALLTSIAVFVGYNLLYGMKAGIDNAAHVGGLISGLIIGYSFLPSLREEEEPELKFRTIIFLVIPVTIFALIPFKTLPNDFPKYDKLMQEFVKTEHRALQIHKLSPDAAKERLLYEIKNRGIYYWNENISIMKEVQKLKLPQQIQDRNIKLLEYCQLRIKGLELTYKAIEQESPMYQTQIENYNKQIENIITELTGNNNGG
jgi:rhomboid protease GluP